MFTRVAAPCCLTMTCLATQSECWWCCLFVRPAAYRHCNTTRYWPDDAPPPHATRPLSLSGYPLPLTEPAKRWINCSVHNDTHFLADCKVMDYSILVGIDEVSGGMVIGIIDYVRASAVARAEACVSLALTVSPPLQQIRRFDTAADFEYRFKNLTRADEPTVVQPRRYRDRLR